METFSPRRAALVYLLLGASFLALVGRVGYLQTFGRELTLSKADRQQHQTLTLQARRGSIFDRNGFLLAGTVQTQTLFVDPKFMYEVYQQDGHSLIEMDDATIRLSKLIDKDPLQVAQLLADRSSYRFVKIAENLDDATCIEIQKLKLPGVGLQPTNERYYPMGSLAAHLMGGTMKNGIGLDGLELQFEKTLAGRDGYARLLKDASHRPLAMAAEDYLPPQHGQHLILTIDANIQMIAEQELASAVTENHAKRGEVVVMDPKTGEVLALANYPTFSPQNYQDATPEVRRNSTLVLPYEAGSTIKPFILGPALEWHATKPGEVWPINAESYNVPNSRRIITDTHFYGPTWDVLVKSSNIGMCMLGERMGNHKLHKALTLWGFGRPTGIELPGEGGGVLRPLKQWKGGATESISQGYEIEVTPMQLARAFCAYANGGRLVRPTLIKGILNANDHVVPRTLPAVLEMLPAAIDPITAAEMKRIMCDVVIRGTATKARSDVWNIFGKTGTAHISEGKRGYSKTRFNSSFLCGAPAENPRLVVAMIVHEPDKKIAHYGGNVSGPAAKRLIERALSYLQVPSSPDLPPPPASIIAVLNHYNEKLYQRKTTQRNQVAAATARHEQ
jgi:cell division protein FtsI/penicillin-binding protein 2